jgi:hypothetical protein
MTAFLKVQRAAHWDSYDASVFASIRSGGPITSALQASFQPMQILEDYQRRPNIDYLAQRLLRACESGADYSAALKSIQESQRTWTAALQLFLSFVTCAKAGVQGLYAEYMRDQSMVANARWGTHAKPIELEKVKALKRRVEQGDELARKLVDGWTAEAARLFVMERLHKSQRRQV